MSGTVITVHQGTEVRVLKTGIEVSVLGTGIEVLTLGVQGPAGIQGVQGIQGAAGSQILSGSGVPDAGLGSDGDFYLDTATGDYYLKAAGAWALQGNLTGPAGATGPAGFGAFGPLVGLSADATLEAGKVYGAIAPALNLTLPAAPADGATIGVACAVGGSYVSVSPASGLLNGNQASCKFGAVIGTLRFIYFSWSSAFNLWNIVDYGSITAWHISGVYHDTQFVRASDGIIYTNIGGAGQSGFDPVTDGGVHWRPVSDLPDPGATVSEFESAQITPTSALFSTFAHGLGGAPDVVELIAECIGTINGYNIGNLIRLSVNNYQSNIDMGATLLWDATNVYMQQGANAALYGYLKRTATIGQRVTILNGDANWRLRIRARRFS